jgi:hypothetical protein
MGISRRAVDVPFLSVKVAILWQDGMGLRRRDSGKPSATP